jgi:Arc/MetJ family transcription regulator
LKATSNDDIYDDRLRAEKMRTTLALDDELLADAEFNTGIREKSALVREALKALIEREAARRLARLGGSEPGLAEIPRRRTKRG